MRGAVGEGVGGRGGGSGLRVELDCSKAGCLSVGYGGGEGVAACLV